MLDMFVFGAMIDSVFVGIFQGIGAVWSGTMECFKAMDVRHFSIAFAALVLFGTLCMKGLGVKKS